MLISAKSSVRLVIRIILQSDDKREFANAVKKIIEIRLVQQGLTENLFDDDHDNT